MSKIEYTETINYVVTTQPDLVAGYIDELNQRIAELEKQLDQANEDKMWLNVEIDTLKSEKENLMRTLEESAERIREQDTKWQNWKRACELEGEDE